MTPSRGRMVGTGWVPEGNRSRAALHAAGLFRPGRIRNRAKALRLFMEVERRHPREPHWYLALLATDPSAQGRGFGQHSLFVFFFHRSLCAGTRSRYGTPRSGPGAVRSRGNPRLHRDPEEGQRLLVRAFGLRRGERDHASGDTHGLVPGPHALGLMVCTGVSGAPHRVLLVVGLAGFEPATSGPPDQRANQPAPQPGKRAS